MVAGMHILHSIFVIQACPVAPPAMEESSKTRTANEYARKHAADCRDLPFPTGAATSQKLPIVTVELALFIVPHETCPSRAKFNGFTFTSPQLFSTR